MTSLFDRSIQVVLQRPTPAGLTCQCFGGIPSPSPALIVVLPAGGAQTEQDAKRAASAMSRALRSLSTQASTVPPPCGPNRASPTGCMAHQEPACRRVLLLMGDGVVPMADAYGAITHWTRQMPHPQFIVIPSLPASMQARAAATMPPALQAINAHFWFSDPSEVVPAVLAAAGVTTEDYRVFISYRRREGEIVAHQLFDELNRRNFDVFLDQCRMDPGVSFQERLTEELAHKSMVVLIETATIDQSRWVEHEVAYAVRFRLGLLAVQLPGGISRPEVDARRRIFIRSLTPNDELDVVMLNRVCDRIRIIHSMAILRRRHQMRQAMRNSLLVEGVQNQRMTADGLLEAHPRALPVGDPYRVWLTPRPAELTDFHLIHAKTGTTPQRRPVVIAPAALLPGRRQAAAHWLANVAKIHYHDESQMHTVARRIAGGTL